MTRRTLSALLMVPPSGANRLPVDVARLNEFAELYNAYVAALKEFKADTKMWARVERAWDKL